MKSISHSCPKCKQANVFNVENNLQERNVHRIKCSFCWQFSDLSEWIQVTTMNGTERKNIRPGLLVDIVLKADQPTGKLTRGRVKDILTNSAVHHRGIKVRLEDGQIGRVQVIIPE